MAVPSAAKVPVGQHQADLERAAGWLHGLSPVCCSKMQSTQRDQRSGWSRCGEWPQSVNSSNSGLRHAPRDAADLLQRAVLVVQALHGQQRAARWRDFFLDRPVAERRVQPDVVPAPEGASRGRRGTWPGAGAGRCPGRPSRAPRCWPPTGLRPGCAARARWRRPWPAGNARRTAARSSRRRCGRTARAGLPPHRCPARQQRRQHLVRLAVHEVQPPGLFGGARRRAAVARARIDQAAQPAASHRRCGKSFHIASEPSPSCRKTISGAGARVSGAIQACSMRTRPAPVDEVDVGHGPRSWAARSRARAA
jgi:hypothetical protein